MMVLKFLGSESNTSFPSGVPAKLRKCKRPASKLRSLREILFSLTRSSAISMIRTSSLTGTSSRYLNRRGLPYRVSICFKPSSPFNFRTMFTWLFTKTPFMVGIGRLVIAAHDFRSRLCGNIQPTVHFPEVCFTHRNGTRIHFDPFPVHLFYLIELHDVGTVYLEKTLLGQVIINIPELAVRTINLVMGFDHYVIIIRFDVKDVVHRYTDPHTLVPHKNAGRITGCTAFGTAGKKSFGFVDGFEEARVGNGLVQVIDGIVIECIGTVFLIG